MKITDIKSYPTFVGFRNQLIVKVETDEGIYGLGESGLSGRELAVAGAIKHYREWLIGRDPMQTGALWQEMYRSQYFEGGRVLTAAQSALDIAFYDIAGKALGVPVHQLLGGKHRHHIPTFATCGADTPEQAIEKVQLLLDAGWDCIRLNAGFGGSDDPNVFEPRHSIGVSSAVFTAVREAVGPHPVIGTDIHHRFSVAETASLCQRLPRGTLDWIEEPIRDECPEAYAALRQMTEIPFAIGEEMSSKWQFLPYIERGLTNYGRVDVSNIGGLTEAMKVVAMCEAHYIDMMPHNPLGPICTAATLHMAAASPNFSWLEVRATPTEDWPIDYDLFPVQPELEGAWFPVPDGPGLGVEFNEELASQREFRFNREHRLRRRDGSVTNA